LYGEITVRKKGRSGVEGPYVLPSVVTSLGIETHDAEPLKSDNTAAQTLAKNPENHERAMHIDTKYHLVRDEVEKKRIALDLTHRRWNSGLVYCLLTRRILRSRNPYQGYVVQRHIFPSSLIRHLLARMVLRVARQERQRRGSFRDIVRS
jgi:hypothetical protein